MKITTLEGQLHDAQGRYALVVARFNSFVVESLVDGALDMLRRHGIGEDAIRVLRVPGAFEVPLVVKQLAHQGQEDAIIALGAVIRGSTPHFDYVCAESTKGIGQVSLETGVPVINGIITVNSIEQAIERAGTKAGNKGAEAALGALEMVSLMRQLKAPSS